MSEQFVSLMEFQTFLQECERLVAASDKVGIDRDTPNAEYLEFCAAVELVRRRLSEIQGAKI